VVLPVVVRDVYRGSSEQLASVNFAFWIGTIVASFATARLAANVRRRGWLVMAAISWGVVILAAIAVMPSFEIMLALCLCWGLGAGVTMSQGRTIIQTVSPLPFRSRHLALFQLGFMGGAPIGALAMGAIAQTFGLTVAMLAPAACMAVFIGFMALRSGLLRDDTTEA
jgi:MFS family permease